MLRTLYRLSVCIPPSHVDALRTALRETGSLQSTHYSDVIWVSAVGEEQFTPLPGARPHKGSPGVPQIEPSVLVMFSIAHHAGALEQVLQAIHAAHPWEEPVVYIDETQTYLTTLK